MKRDRGRLDRCFLLFTLATGSKFLFITVTTSSAALKDYFLPLLRRVQLGCRPSSMPVVLSYGNVFKLSPWLSTVHLLSPFQAQNIAENETSLKILNRVAAKFDKLESRRVQSSAVWIFITTVVRLSSSFYLSLFNYFHQNATYFSDKHQIYENVWISASLRLTN